MTSVGALLGRALPDHRGLQDRWGLQEQLPAVADVELSDDELEQVVGGLARVPIDLVAGGEESDGPSIPSLQARASR
jgi:bacteriocin-like protein